MAFYLIISISYYLHFVSDGTYAVEIHTLELVIRVHQLLTNRVQSDILHFKEQIK